MPNYVSGGANDIDVGQDLKKAIYALIEALTEDEKQLSYLLNGHISSININYLTADKITTGTLDAGLVTIRANYEGGAFIELSANGIRINDGTKDTFVADTHGNLTLSGRIESSVIVGSEIKTSETEYPRIELSTIGKFFKALGALGKEISISSSTDGTPAIFYNYDGKTATMFLSDSLLVGTGSSVNMSVSPGGNLFLSPNGTVKVDNWTKFVNGSNSHTLQQDLDTKATKSNQNTTFTFVTSVDFLNEKFTTRTATVVDGVITSIS